MGRAQQSAAASVVGLIAHACLLAALALADGSWSGPELLVCVVLSLAGASERRVRGAASDADRSAVLLGVSWLAVVGLSLAWNDAWLGIGLAPMALGLALRQWAIVTLGAAYGDGLVPGAIVTSGPYAWTRHPGEIGGALFALGLATFLGSVAGALAWLLLLVPATVYRLRLEDRAVSRAHPAAFERYAARVGWLLRIDRAKRGCSRV